MAARQDVGHAEVADDRALDVLGDPRGVAELERAAGPRPTTQW